MERDEPITFTPSSGCVFCDIGIPCRAPGCRICSPITTDMEVDADADIAAGRVTRHNDLESFIAALDVPEQSEE